MFGTNLVILDLICDEISRGLNDFSRMLSQNVQWPPFSITAESVPWCMFGANLVIPSQIYELSRGQCKGRTDGQTKAKTIPLRPETRRPSSFSVHEWSVSCELRCNVKKTLRWRHNEHDSVSNHQPHDCLLNRLFRRRSKKTSKLDVTGLCAGNSSGTGEFSAQMTSNAENASIWWRHHGA